MRYGFIGYGNMGRTLLLSLLNDRSLTSSQVALYNRTLDRPRELAETFPDIIISAQAAEVAQCSDMVFICTLTSAVCGVMQEIAPALRPNAHVITINGGITIADIEKFYDGPVSKVMPSLTLAAERGITLVAHGPKVPPDMSDRLNGLFQRSSRVKVVSEGELERSTDLTSCAPGWMAMMFESFVQAGARASQLPLDEARELVLETWLGTSLTLANGTDTPQGLMGKVATKGGITEQGLLVLERELPGVFDRVFEASRKKRDSLKGIVTDSSCRQMEG